MHIDHNIHISRRKAKMLGREMEGAGGAFFCLEVEFPEQGVKVNIFADSVEDVEGFANGMFDACTEARMAKGEEEKKEDKK